MVDGTAESLTQARARLHDLQREVDRLVPAAAYMQQLLEVITRYQLQDEWHLFLRCANFPDLDDV